MPEPDDSSVDVGFVSYDFVVLIFEQRVNKQFRDNTCRNL